MTLAKPDKPQRSLQRHRALVVLIYLLAAGLAWLILRQPEAQKDLIALLSAGAIFATFGSALSTIGGIWERDLIERVRLNIDIFYQDIIKQENPWRRWPFLPRIGKRALLDGSVHIATLSNPDIPLNVGTHVIQVALPTVLEDFFDLPLRKNVGALTRHRTAAATFCGNQEKNTVDEKTGMKRSDAYMAYECLHDIWIRILQFRLARYLSHFGIGLTVAGCLFTALFLALRPA